MRRFLTLKIMGISVLTALLIVMQGAAAQETVENAPCRVEAGSLCALEVLEAEAAQIENTNWRDQIYREIAKLLAAEGLEARAMGYLPRIETPDTKAMTIRGIGMAAAELDWDTARYDALFTGLRTHAETITHPPSYAIALTYIAMAQAFAGDNEGAWATAAAMENDALRHKAYGETAEIQAEGGDAGAAMKSISFIESAAYRNKAYSIVAKILTDRGRYTEAFEAAQPISNAFKKAQTITYLLDKKRHEELSRKLQSESE